MKIVRTVVTAMLVLCAPDWALAQAVAAPPKVESAAGHAESAAGVSPDAALRMLVDGNARFVAGKLQHPNDTAARRTEVAKGQHPFAVILSCSDSRVPPEVVFDAGLGDLFVIRVAGNTADDLAVGSIEYAVEHAGASLVVVLGHERCGAVTAAVGAAKSKDPAPGHLAAVLDPIKPAVAKVAGKTGDILDMVSRENVARVVAQLSESAPVLADRVKAGTLKIVGGRYDLDTGAVEFKP